MATITARTRRDGTTGYTAQIHIKKAGKIVHTESETFDRKQAAVTWAKMREAKLAKPGALDVLKQPDPTLGEAIDQYIRESRRALGRTKEQVLRAIKAAPLGGRQPHYCIVLPRPEGQAADGWELPSASCRRLHGRAPRMELPAESACDRRCACRTKKLGLTSRSVRRERRPSLDELNRILTHFSRSRAKHIYSVDMVKVTGFALFSIRRLEEITRITWKDLDEAGSRVMVRDMKHPGEKIGNDQWCDLPPEALRIIQSMPQTDERIFPWSGDAIGAQVTRAMKFLEIDDLHFHDLRHEGVSRLFEMGWNIPHVAAVSGHRSWNSLKRYTHLRQTGDKYESWHWLATLAPDNAASVATERNLRIVG